MDELEVALDEYDKAENLSVIKREVLEKSI